MARTYRGRHLPRFAGTGAKLIDARCYHRLKESDYPRRIDLLGSEQQPDVNCGPPVEWVGDHPWVRWYFPGNRIKVWYKKHGNRIVRRKEANLLRRWAFQDDDFQDYIPRKKDGWDTWSLS